MAFEYFITDNPCFVPHNYLEIYGDPCKIIREGPMDHEWYRGFGIPPEEHPLNHKIPFCDCHNCESVNVLVIAAQYDVNALDGEEYYNYELFCEDCEKFTRACYVEHYKPGQNQK